VIGTDEFVAVARATIALLPCAGTYLPSCTLKSGVGLDMFTLSIKPPEYTPFGKNFSVAAPVVVGDNNRGESPHETVDSINRGVQMLLDKFYAALSEFCVVAKPPAFGRAGSFLRRVRPSEMIFVSCITD
jgi:hypothetical protein